MSREKNGLLGLTATVLGIAALAIILLYFLWTNALHGIFHTWLYRHFFQTGFVVGGIALAIYGLFQWPGEYSPRFHKFIKPVSIIAAGIFVAVGGLIWSSAMTKAEIAQMYKPELRESVPETDPIYVRFTPLEVAYQEMVQGLSASHLSVDENLIDAVDVNGKLVQVRRKHGLARRRLDEPLQTRLLDPIHGDLLPPAGSDRRAR
jgi:hypothetical protein